MKEAAIILIIQAVTTFMLFGISWFLQVVHFPLYRMIKEGFVQYERAQMRFSSCLIIPIMIIETVTAILLLTAFVHQKVATLVIANLVVLVLTWIVTLLFQVKYHQSLSVRSSQETVKKLLRSNWVRAILWTIKAGIVSAIIYYLLCR